MLLLRSDLASKLPLPVDEYSLDSPHTKTHLLFQAHFSRVPLPIADYLTDTKSVLDQAIRILQVCLIRLCMIYEALPVTVQFDTESTLRPDKLGDLVTGVIPGS